MPRAALGERGESVVDKGGKCFSLFQCSIRHTRYVVPGMTIYFWRRNRLVSEDRGEYVEDRRHFQHTPERLSSGSPTVVSNGAKSYISVVCFLGQ